MSDTPHDTPPPAAAKRPGPSFTSTLPLMVLALIAVVTALRLADSFFAPITLAIVAGVVLSPISDFWERRGLPRAFGAMVSMLLTLVLAAALVMSVQPILSGLLSEAPKVASDVTRTLEDLRHSFRNISEMSENVSQALNPEAPPGPAPPDPGGKTDVPGLTDAVMLAPQALTQMMIFAGTLFFFLATRMDVYAWLARLFPQAGLSQQHLCNADRMVSRYFGTITLINAGLGLLTGTVLTALGLPAAPQWGLLAFFANFVVYLGPAVFAASLLVAGIASFDGIMSLAPMAIYLFFNFSEGQFITPALVGQTMRINPLAVFLSVIFGLWLWGAAGGIVAIPLLVWMLFLTKEARAA